MTICTFASASFGRGIVSAAAVAAIAALTPLAGASSSVAVSPRGLSSPSRHSHPSVPRRRRRTNPPSSFPGLRFLPSHFPRSVSSEVPSPYARAAFVVAPTASSSSSAAARWPRQAALGDFDGGDSRASALFSRRFHRSKGRVSPIAAASAPSGGDGERDDVSLNSSSSSLQRIGTTNVVGTIIKSVSGSVDINLADATTDSLQLQLETFSRIVTPSLIAALVAGFLFPVLSLSLSDLIADAGVFAVLAVDSSQFVQNFLTVTGLTFSILVGQTYYFMYQQQEAVFTSLFREVTEAKSLLEQVALVCQGRRAMYRICLESIARYVEEDLKRLDKDPAVLLSARPVDDPLETIMYMTSVGVPSSVYETVRSLRQARAVRLGALQRKLPGVHIGLLWLLAIIELSSFPVLGAGTQTIGGYNILIIEGCCFGVMVFGIVMTLCVVGELWQTAGGAYNVDGVLAVMVRGLDEELQTRMADMDATTSRDGVGLLPAADRTAD